MKVLIIGQGGREHAIVRGMQNSTSVSEVHVAPGNSGIGIHTLCHRVDINNHDEVVELCLRLGIDLVVVGPEEPLVNGIADTLRGRGILVFGPNKDAARLEGSKLFCKSFLAAADVPTAKFVIVESLEDCLKKSENFSPPYVLKFDGLAAGKGVFVCKNFQELQRAAESIFIHKRFSSDKNLCLLEECLVGYEMSVLALTNGAEFVQLPLSQDHKRVYDGDLGPNTGGMGCVAPIQIANDLKKEIEERILAPIVSELSRQALLYRGILFVGIMVTKDGPKVLEINTRFGDPETQVVLPLIDGDLGSHILAVAQGKMPKISFKDFFAACVVMAAPGYPDEVKKGDTIKGDLNSETESSYFLHSGTLRDKANSEWVVNGGRVLGAIGIGGSLEEAIKLAYRQSDKVSWNGLVKRSDIGKDCLKKNS